MVWAAPPPCCRNRLSEVQARADAAELAKIELSLKVAELAANAAEDTPAGGDIDAVPSSACLAALAGRDTDGGEEGLSEAEAARRQVEVAELAAAAAARRATAAEAELDKLKVQLAEAEKRCRELAWQIKMLADPAAAARAGAGEGGGAGGAANQVARIGGMLDILGCALSYNRRGQS